MRKLLFCVAVVAMATVSCTPISESNDKPYSYYSNDGQIQYFENLRIDLYQESGDSGITSSLRAAGGRAKVTEDWGYTIERVAQILPLKVDGVATQANDIVLSIEGKTAVIAYNTAGEIFSGGLQVLNLSDPSKPVLTASVPLPGKDVNALFLDGNTLYFGGMQDPDTMGNYTEPDKSFIAKADLSNLTTENALSIFNGTLPSHTVTGITVKDGLVYVSVGGASGELLYLDTDLSTVTAVVTQDGFRDVASYNKGVLLLGGPVDGLTSSGTIFDYRTDTVGIDTEIDLTGFGSEEHKATIEIYNNRYAILGLSRNGLKVVDLKDAADTSALTTEDYLFELTNPTATWSDKTYTNSASYSGDLIFTANGEYGFRVLQFAEPESANSWENRGLDFAHVVGYVSFEDHPTDSGGFWSANEIVYRKNSIIVASGEGGVNIYKTTITQ